MDLVILNDDILEYEENFMVQLASRSDEVEITATGEQAEIVIREDSADCKSNLNTIILLFLELHPASCILVSMESIKHMYPVNSQDTYV